MNELQIITGLVLLLWVFNMVALILIDKKLNQILRKW
jgi:hypothetical protein